MDIAREYLHGVGTTKKNMNMATWANTKLFKNGKEEKLIMRNFSKTLISMAAVMAVGSAMAAGAMAGELTVSTKDIPAYLNNLFIPFPANVLKDPLWVNKLGVSFNLVSL